MPTNVLNMVGHGQHMEAIQGVMITKLTRNNPAIISYATRVFGTLDLTDAQWKQCEEQMKVNMYSPNPSVFLAPFWMRGQFLISLASPKNRHASIISGARAHSFPQCRGGVSHYLLQLILGLVLFPPGGGTIRFLVGGSGPFPQFNPPPNGCACV